jgi:hypothetical protein
MMMNVKNMFVFSVAFVLLSLSFATCTDGLSLRVVARPATSSTVAARPVQTDVELSTPSVVTGVPVTVAHVVQDLSAPQDPVAQDYVEGVPVEGVPVARVFGITMEGSSTTPQSQGPVSRRVENLVFRNITPRYDQFT